MAIRQSDALGEASAAGAEEVLASLGVSMVKGLSSAEITERRARWGPNAVATHRAHVGQVLWRQVRSPLLLLLLVTAAASSFLGEHSDAVIIGVIVGLSVGLGFVNEYRAERAAAAMHAKIRHTTVVRRDGVLSEVDVTDLVPGDLVTVKMGDVVPADLRLVETSDLACIESILTGEGLPADKSTTPVPAGTALAELTDCALMGTVVSSGEGRGVVVATGSRAVFGRIAAGLSAAEVETGFQKGLRRFSMFLVEVGGVLTALVFVINVLGHKPLLDALMFSLAIAVGITPQLLPAVVSTSLAAGSRHLARVKVLVKRLVCIEDLGDMALLLTDKTGTLTEGRIRFIRQRACSGVDETALTRLALLATESDVSAGRPVGGNPLDQALWDGVPGDVTNLAGWMKGDLVPFDHRRRMTSAVVRDPGGAGLLVTKGAPEAVLDRCREVPEDLRRAVEEEFAQGNRVVAVASKRWDLARAPRADDEHGLSPAGLLVFLDPPKAGVGASLGRLRELGVDVKIVTGDNPVVALKVCRDIGLTDGTAITGPELAGLSDDELAARMPGITVFARVSPEDKARIVHVGRSRTGGVGFLGDGVNDAPALHAADVGISVDTATDVAKDAADVILLEKDLDVLADGVTEGRRIFANTIKYVMMGTSSNFGNMFSAAGGSTFLRFLPMLPGQILLNNLLYDAGQLAIPTDHVDEERLHRPSHWDIGFIRRFMLVFGPLSSLFDFATFALMLGLFHAGESLFQTGWFVESLATQALIIFVIRTHRVPFLRSRPSLALTVTSLAVVLVGAVLPATPVARLLGFTPLPVAYFGMLVGLVVTYLVLVELGKYWFYRVAAMPTPAQAPKGAVVRPHARRVHRRAAPFHVSPSRSGRPRTR
ncbi:magnesium-translocating P-type ATPase [Raineyella fluvialis]|uniref:magnesium-translocating P-type ATPase n=1 Tax=Raineyella fluvialis TaxID=2662261 RepID=UPI0024116B56|nr:magnesium-translocating P-type ATPase [Raineyella fluvialis]